MIQIQNISQLDTFGNMIYIIDKDGQLPGELDSKVCEWIASRISSDKQFIHVNLFDRQVYVIVVADKKHQWQNDEQLRRRGAEAFHSLCVLKQESVGVCNLSCNPSNLMLVAEGMFLCSYQFTTYFKEQDKKENSLKEIVVSGIEGNVLDENVRLWQSVFTTKELVNEPVMSLPSTAFVSKIEDVCREANISLCVRDKAWLEAEGMGGILAVNKGSIDPPYLCVMEWKPRTCNNDKPIVLVGKGVMYDTGGLSLKTSGGMETMKADMSGGAAVLGAMRAVATNKLPLHVVGIIPITDNRPGFNAYAPGDIIKMHNGLFVEVLNTDAEGRMLLADALSWAKTLDPQLVVDIATLTGAANAAVGENAAVTMGTANQEAIDRLVSCSMRVHERLVQFPLWDDYADHIKSEVADLKNVGGPLAGAITAGKFLESFTSYPWIHIDMAGSAYHPKGGDYRGKGATGMGVRLLYSFLKTFV